MSELEKMILSTLYKVYLSLGIPFPEEGSVETENYKTIFGDIALVRHEEFGNETT